jgi:hypothetical protein
MSTEAGPDAGPAELAERAAEMVRALVYATGAGGQQLRWPGEVYDVLGALRDLAHRLPQACDQLARFLASELEAGRVSATDGVFAGDAPAATASAEEWLAQASVAARRLAECWGSAHTWVAGLSGTAGD